MNEYKWYDFIEDSSSIEQGDIFECVPFYSPVSLFVKDRDIVEDIGNIEDVDIVEYQAVVMSQSCDLENGKLEHVIFCPIHPMDDYLAKIPNVTNASNSPNKEKTKNKEMENLRKGERIGFHLLNKCDIPENENGYLIVDLKNPFVVPFSLIPELIKNNPKRIRLCPPYREHLSQSFARVFMRVGLPNSIEPFK